MSSDSESGHASSEDLAAYLSRRLSGEDLAAVERHLVECESCRAELAAAQDLLSRRKRPMQMAGALGIAAVAVALVLMLRTPQSGISPLDNVPLSRGTTPFTTISIIEPKDGAITADTAIVFRWSPSGTGAEYRITVVSEAGDAVWTAETADTRIALPTDVRLTPGTRYMWYIDATRSGVDSLASGPISFRTK